MKMNSDISHILGVVDTDIRLLVAELKKAEGPMSSFVGMLQHSQLPAIKDASDRALAKLKSIAEQRGGIAEMQQALEVLRPFCLACETKHAKLACIALSTFQKLLANDVVGATGRTEIIAAFQMAERLNDESVKLRILQASLTIIQNPVFADDQDGVCQLLSIVLRLYTGNQNKSTVLNTAAATVRQAVALIFDHALMTPKPGTGSPPRPDAAGREAVPLALLNDIVTWCSGQQQALWLKCPAPSRTFLLDLLESVLLQRAIAFHRLPHLTVALRQRVCGLLEGLLASALDPDVTTSAMVDCRLVVRCAAAVVRRHHALAPDKCAIFLRSLGKGLGSHSTDWQRIMVLQTLRPLLADSVLVYKLHELYDQPPGSGDTPAEGLLAGLSRCFQDTLRGFGRLAVDNPEDDVVAMLGSVYGSKAAGQDVFQDLDAMGPMIPGAEIITAFYSLECVLGLTASIEALTDVVVVPAEPGMPSPKLVRRDAGDIRVASCQRLVESVWRQLLSSQTALLCRTNHEVLINVVMRSFQGLTYSAGALGVKPARDGLLQALCSYTLTNPDDEAQPPGQQADGSVGGLTRHRTTGSGAPPAPGVSGSGGIPSSSKQPRLLTVVLDFEEGVVLNPRNVAALRALFNLAHRLADVLGSAWLYVVDVVDALDRMLASPRTTTATAQQEPNTQDPEAPSLPALPANSSTPERTTAQKELLVLASAANQLFENTHHMSPEGVISLLSALSEVSLLTLPGLASSTTAALSSAIGGGMSLAPGGPASAAPSGNAGMLSGPHGGLPGSSAGAPVPGAASLATVGPLRLFALSRMVDTLLHNLWRIQDLWGIFLAHMLEVLRSSSMQVRAAGLDALDRTITGALNPELHVVPDKFTMPISLHPSLSLSFSSSTPPAQQQPITPTGSGPGTGGFPRSPRATNSSIGRASDGAVTPNGSGGLLLPGQPPPSGPMPIPGQVPWQSLNPDVVRAAATSPGPSRSPSGSAGGAGPQALGRPASQTSPSGGGAPPLLQPVGSSPMLRPPLPSQSPRPLLLPQSPSMSSHILSPMAQTPPPILQPPPQLQQPVQPRTMVIGGVLQAAQREDVQNMLLVALESLYREDRETDVRKGLLRIVLHLLQAYGDELTRGWVPLLRLLEAVPRKGQEPVLVRLGWQCVELLCSDFIVTLPKEHIPKALEVVGLFAHQDVILNVSLTAITMLWNVSDTLARSRGTLSKAAGQHSGPGRPSGGGARGADAGATVAPDAQPSALQPGSPPSGTSSLYSSPPTNTQRTLDHQMSASFAAALSFAHGHMALPAAGGGSAGPSSGGTVVGSAAGQQSAAGTRQGGAPADAAHGARPYGGALHDLDEQESINLLMIAFRSLKAVCMDSRPESRNAATRTVFLAVGSHGAKFGRATWQELWWETLFPLVRHSHRMTLTSSADEAPCVELGREKGGRAVMMLVHHSRNSEQKQWEETLVLALVGATKVLRSHLAVLSSLDVWTQAWGELMQVNGAVLSAARKNTASAAISLISTLVQAHGQGPLMQQWMWRQALAAMDQGVMAMALPMTPCPLQTRQELLTCMTLVYSTLREQLEPDDVRLLFRWLDRFARYPVGCEDSSVIHFSTIGPIQKVVLAGFAVLAPLPPACVSVWPDLLACLCNMLRPFTTLPLRQYAQALAAAQAKDSSNRGARASLSSMPNSEFTSSPLGTPSATPDLPNGNSTSASAAGGASPCQLSPQPSGPGTALHAAVPDVVSDDPLLEARAMSPLWMAKISELAATWYRDHVTWQVRVATFPMLVAALSECMACRHLRQQVTEPLEELWRMAARGFVTVVQTGLPSINICSQGGQQQVPQSTWPALQRAFQMFLLGDHLPVLATPPMPLPGSAGAILHNTLSRVPSGLQRLPTLSHYQAVSEGGVPPSGRPTLQLTATSSSLTSPGPLARDSNGGAAGPTGPSFSGLTPFASVTTGHACPPTPSVGAASVLQRRASSLEQQFADLEVIILVLDCLSETVLSACQYAPPEVRRALVHVIDAAAGAPVQPCDDGLPASSRLSHVCLVKLYVLCSRGQDGDAKEQSTRCQLEVAQLALPVFLSRCESVLHRFAAEERAARLAIENGGTGTAAAAAVGACGAAQQGSDAAALHVEAGEARDLGPPSTSASPHGLPPLPPTPPGAPRLRLAIGDEVLPSATSAPANYGPPNPSPAAPSSRLRLSTDVQQAAAPLPSPQPAAHVVTDRLLAEKAAHVLELLLQLRVLPVVTDSLLPSRPQLKPWMDVVRGHRHMGHAPGLQPASSGGHGGTVQSISRRSSSSWDVALADAAAALLPSRGPSLSGTSGGSATTPTAAQAAARSMGLAPRVPSDTTQRSGKEQTHLLGLYGVLCECISCQDPRIRATVGSMLLAIGAELALC